MWGLQYDENLQNNSFFNEILKNHSDLLVKASQENWIICIPRANTIDNNQITIEAILDHILVSSRTLSKKQVVIRDKEIHIEDYPPVRILFEEVFYIDNLKYVVFCLNKPLFSKTVCEDHKVNIVETLDDCIDFLWNENLSHILIKLQKLCASFIEQNPGLAMESLQNQKDLIGSLYSQCLQIVYKNRKLGECDNVQLAVETYMQSCLGKYLIKAVNTATCFSDQTLNKITRNCVDLQLRDLSIASSCWDIISGAKSELNKINNYVTVLDKINCLKLTLHYLYTNASFHFTAEDTLQILVYLIVKLNISNWTANLVYLTRFQFSSNRSEDAFVIASLEAALEFIKSEQFHKVNKSCGAIFEAIVTDDLEQLQTLLSRKTKDVRALCHPLCSCEHCSQDSDEIAIFNEKGQSLLIFAAIIGRPRLVEFLISVGADVDLRDYFGKSASHYACLKGHQDVLLILTNCKADVNIKDSDGNTPLHLACLNGFESCVKALFYTCKDIEIDCVNKFGDTPLHLAVKWNQVGIVRVLLENKALASIANRKNQIPLHLAQNYYTERLLNQYHSHLEQIPSQNKEHGIKPKNNDGYKKIDLLLKAIENNDIPLTCFYLGFSGSNDYSFESKCHPLCNCEKCEDGGSPPKTIVDKINVNTCNIDGFTPLHFAAKYGRTELLRILLDSRALPNLKTYKTLQSPLHLACIHKKLQVLKELVNCGDCDLDALDYKMNTPLYYACVKNEAKIVQVLLGNGASCDFKNIQGQRIFKELEEKNLGGSDDDFL